MALSQGRTMIVVCLFLHTMMNGYLVKTATNQNGESQNGDTKTATTPNGDSIRGI